MAYQLRLVAAGEAISEAGRIGGGSYINADGKHPTVTTNAFTVTGINDLGQAVGFFQENDFFSTKRGVLYDGQNISQLNMVPSDMNGSGEIIGNTTNRVSLTAAYPGPSYLYSNGQYTPIAVPNGSATNVEGISESGAIVGTYVANGQHGFVYKGGVYTTFDISGSPYTSPTDINDKGTVVGYDGQRGFVFHDGGFDFINVPGAQLTQVRGVNNDGKFVGSFVKQDSTTGYFEGEHLNEVYRFLDTATGDHFYTSSKAEKAVIESTLPTFRYEGTPWAAPDKGSGTIDVFRFYDMASRTHFYTASAAERDAVIAGLPTYRYEGVAFQTYAKADDPGETALIRFFNTIVGSHHFAADAAEVALLKSGAVGQGWVEEGPSLVVHDVGSGLYLV